METLKTLASFQSINPSKSEYFERDGHIVLESFWMDEYFVIELVGTCIGIEIIAHV